MLTEYLYVEGKRRRTLGDDLLLRLIQQRVCLHPIINRTALRNFLRVKHRLPVEGQSVSESVPGIFAQRAGMQVYVESGEPSHDVTGEQTMRGELDGCDVGSG